MRVVLQVGTPHKFCGSLFPEVEDTTEGLHSSVSPGRIGVKYYQYMYLEQGHGSGELRGYGTIPIGSDGCISVMKIRV